MIIKGYIFSILYVLLCILVAAIVYKLGAPKHITRKVIHILVGFEWVILYYFFGAASPHFLAVCLLFLALLTLEYKMHLVPMMSSDGENAPGTVYYAVAMSVMALITLFVPNMIYPFGISVFCTSLGDGLAGLAGQGIKRLNFKIWDNKTAVGAAVNFAVCFAVPLLFSEIFGFSLSVCSCLLIAAFALQLELFAGRGLDNIFITVGVSLLAYALMYLPEIYSYIVPIILTPLVLALCLKKRALTPWGIVGALALDVVVSLAFGNIGFVILLVFLAGGVLSDKFKKVRNKNGQMAKDSQSECRGIGQVFSNGFVALLCAIAYLIMGNRLLFVVFAASMSEALADTVASGVGSSAKYVYDVFRFEKCSGGISGGISVKGTLSSLVASFFVAAIPLCFGAVTTIEFLLVGSAGFVGALFDSFLGSILQAKYKCSVCGKIVEAPIHCSAPAKHYRGIVLVTNSVVNFLSTLFSALMVIVIYSCIT